jgi:hypothetical protein
LAEVKLECRDLRPASSEYEASSSGVDRVSLRPGEVKSHGSDELLQDHKKLVHRAVAEAVERGDIWLVFGNDSVLGGKPTDSQMDPEANLLRPPARLRAMDLLPGALAAAWSGKPETTTVGKLYSELKAVNGRPWPVRQFLDVLNEAVNQGMLVRTSGGREFTSALDPTGRRRRVRAMASLGARTAERSGSSSVGEERTALRKSLSSPRIGVRSGTLVNGAG